MPKKKKTCPHAEKNSDTSPEEAQMHLYKKTEVLDTFKVVKETIRKELTSENPISSSRE